ncbi:MAG: serine protease [Anaerolinea sp.]|nr:serine protease [Anaerolinea sp.]
MKRQRPRFLAALVAAALVSVLAVTLVGPAAAQQGNGKDKLSKHDRELIAEARANGKDTITVLIAAQNGQNRIVASGIASLGGTVRFREDSISYIRAIVPIRQVDAAAKLAGVQALDVDEIIPLEDPRPEGAQPVAPQPAPGAATPAVNPYMPIGDTGAAQFTAAHPTWDGRGTVIGILDTGVSLDHPSLLTTSTGARKVLDWVTYTDPLTDGDPTWIDMSQQVNVAGGSVTVGPNTYSGIAANGTYRFGVFNEAALGPASLGDEYAIGCGGDVNRDGVCGQSFAVLWRTSDNMVWVDSNADKSFAGEPGMTDYKVNYDVGYFGTDNLATPVAERVPFVVQTDGKNKFVNIGIVSGAHGSHVAGITSGNSLFGGAMSGAAPGAQIKSVRVCLFTAGCTSHALIEGMIYVGKQGNVDVINMSIGGLPALNDGNNTRAILYDRIIETYNVQMFISAGNSGAGLNTIGDPSVASKVMSVGSYIHRQTWQKNYGSDSTQDDNMHPFSSRGPREDGGFKPNIIAPGAAISTTPMWQPGGPVGGTYSLPPGYSMFNGTSMAAPQAAGAAALLISAAKQTGVQKQPAQLRQAINSSARFIPGYQAYEQGNGLFQVGAAWDLLKTNIKLAGISSSVPVNTVLSGFLVTPGVGQGIYDREGVAAGAPPYTRTYTFTRTSGGGGTKTYNLSWVGNDGTFGLPAGSIALPLNAPTTLLVNVNAATSGIHSAILNLDDPTTTGIDYQTLNTVVAADPFVGPDFAVTKWGTIGRNQSKSFFFKVPSGTPAFKVDLTGPSTAAGTGQVRFLRFHPYGVGIDSNSSLANYCPSATAPATCPAAALSRTTSNPQAGVWEVTVEARRTSDVDNAPFTLTASILGATVSPNPDIIASATVGVPVPLSYTITNLFGAFTGRAVGTTLGSANRTSQGPIATGQQHLYQVAVTAGSTSLRATIGGTSDLAADLDLFVFNCTALAANPLDPFGTCVPRGQSADGDSEESVTVTTGLTAGTWVVLIDGYAVAAPTTTYNYVDVFANPAFGNVAIADADALRTAGAVWAVPGTVTANAAPAAGRVLLGNVQVRTDTDILIGQGDVVIQAVSP